MIGGGNIGYEDSASIFGNNIFSNNNKEEAEMVNYFLWLRNNSSTLTSAQKSDFDMLKTRQNLNAIAKKDVTTLTDSDKSFLTNMGIDIPTNVRQVEVFQKQIQESFGNANILKSKSQLPSILSYTTGRIDKIGKKNEDFNKANPTNLFRYTDYKTNKSSLFYVIKDLKQFEAVQSDGVVGLETYQNLTDVVKGDKKTSFSSGGLSFGGGKTPQPSRNVKIWYSQDYKETYDQEIQRQALELLNIPDMVLSQYNWETIDSLPDKLGTEYYDEQDQLIDYAYQEPEQIVGSSVSPEAANLIHRIQNESFAPVTKALNPVRSTFVEFLENFGFHKTKNGEIISYFPSYNANGSPRYDLEISFEDVDAVFGYKVFLVEEDGII